MVQLDGKDLSARKDRAGLKGRKMYKNSIAICLSFIFAGGLMIPALGVPDILFDAIYGAAALILAAFLIGLRIHAKKKGLIDYHNSYFWLYNKKRSGGLTALLTAANAAAVVSFAFLVLITRGGIRTDSCLIAVVVFGFQAFDIIKTWLAVSGKAGKKRRGSRREGMSDYELTALNKSANVFLTVGILPLIICILYGDFWYKVIGPLAIFVFSHLVSYFYALFWRRRGKGEWEWSDEGKG